MGFRGNHCDVGGGYAEPGLSDVSLGWMYDQAVQAGVTFATARSALGLKPKPAMAPHRVTAFNYRHQPRTLPVGLEMPADPSPWPIMRLVGTAKGAVGGKGGTAVTPMTHRIRALAMNRALIGLSLREDSGDSYAPDRSIPHSLRAGSSAQAARRRSDRTKSRD